MFRILFVCLGNICRSPMAEYIMRDKLHQKGLSDAIEVASAATSDEEEGNSVYPPARRELAARGLSCAEKRARRIRAEDYRQYNLLIGMEEANLREMRRFFGGDPDGKIRKLMSYCGTDEDVADPWYFGHFAETADQIEHGCEALLRTITEKKG